ncbi:Plant UBX domain-containing protein 4 [Orobanche minor]
MSSRDKQPSKPSSSRAGRIRTLSDLNRPAAHDTDSDSDAPQEYYTGGEKSGMLVQAPSKDNDIDAIFDQARQLGAVRGPLENEPSASSRNFSGTGRLLSGETTPASPQLPESLVHNIVFWRNGFTVNDGPLRRLDDPENAPFIESVVKSECPKELEPSDRRSAVSVNLIRREENCPDPKIPGASLLLPLALRACPRASLKSSPKWRKSEPEVRPVSFQGVGRTLGSSSATDSGPDATVTAPLLTAPSPSMGLVVDGSLPSTSIQLRLADGTRMVTHFNHHHTIADIRSFIDASRPGGLRSYQLQAVGFPPKILTDLNQTIEQAGLLNSVVIQKL